MKAFLRKYANLLNVLFASAVLIGIVAFSGDIGETIRALGDLKLRWVLLGFALLAGYLLLRAMALQFYLKRQGYPIRALDAAVITGVGQFYSAITPSSSGGQPMQVIHMMRRGVPGTVASAAVSVKFIAFQFVVLASGAAAWAMNGALVESQLGPAKGFLILGFTVNSTLLLALVLMVINKNLVVKMAHGIVRFLHRLRIVKNDDALEATIENTLSEYLRSIMTLRKRPLDALVMLAFAIGQVALFTSMIVCVYWAFGLNTATMRTLITLQLLQFITAAFVPLPGAAGAQEGAFHLYFRGFFPEGIMLPAMVIWRFFTYYMLLISGLSAVVFDNIRTMRARKREEKRYGPSD